MPEKRREKKSLFNLTLGQDSYVSQTAQTDPKTARRMQSMIPQISGLLLRELAEPILIDNLDVVFYIADALNYRIRKVDARGIITTVAGTGTAGDTGDGGPATSAKLNQTALGLLDTSGNLYIVDGVNSKIRVVNMQSTSQTFFGVTIAPGNIDTIVGTGTGGFNGDGATGTATQLNHPSNILFDNSGNLLIADEVNARIRKLSVTTNLVSTVVGNGTTGDTGDGGAPTSAKLDHPTSILIDTAGNLYISLFGCVRAVNFSGSPKTVLGTVVAPNTIQTVVANGNNPGDSGFGGPALSAKVQQIEQIVFDDAQNIYLVDSTNNRVTEVTVAGIFSLITGTGAGDFAGDGGLATAADLYSPSGLSRIGTDLYIADSGNSVIRLVNASGIISTFAGVPSVLGYNGDNQSITTAELNAPLSVLALSTASPVMALAEYDENVFQTFTPGTSGSGSGPDPVVFNGGYVPYSISAGDFIYSEGLGVISLTDISDNPIVDPNLSTVKIVRMAYIDANAVDQSAILPTLVGKTLTCTNTFPVGTVVFTINSILIADDVQGGFHHMKFSVTYVSDSFGGDVSPWLGNFFTVT